MDALAVLPQHNETLLQERLVVLNVGLAALTPVSLLLTC
jgi:hypothetical protein